MIPTDIDKQILAQMTEFPKIEKKKKNVFTGYSLMLNVKRNSIVVKMNITIIKYDLIGEIKCKNDN